MGSKTRLSSYCSNLVTSRKTNARLARPIVPCGHPQYHIGTHIANRLLLLNHASSVKRFLIHRILILGTDMVTGAFLPGFLPGK